MYWIFNVGSEKELEQANEIVEKYAIQEYKIEPEYRGDNLPFLKRMFSCMKRTFFPSIYLCRI